ncbi:hypothetical protein KHS38_21615 [Mucilaginibacter sp. Bleaf8]|uniref:hypothetical protein n=1 Tax=Mucilaginibacter sp. Bleaf8 TaxID=2834430 RepID=UPI001BD1BAFA|nr:hypothetical protein [Mucilaginibacter sp. Bleaf8]MBS7567017.1 hypothetical protein [Mucilaginibacter sp. Bleaf8]
MPEIAGTYKAAPADGETKACDLSVQIRKLNGAYAYTFHMNSKVYKGKVKLEKGDNKGEVYVTFMGIELAEYEGDEDEEKRPVKKPVGISGLWSDNQITIQNTGNSMNYYVQIAGCDQKYISLVKTEVNKR